MKVDNFTGEIFLNNVNIVRDDMIVDVKNKAEETSEEDKTCIFNKIKDKIKDESGTLTEEWKENELSG